MDEKTARCLLSLCPSMGPVRFRRLAEAFGSGAAAMEAGPGAWRAQEVLPPAVADGLAGELATARKRLPADLRALEKAGARAVIPGEPDYPEGLASLDDAPFILYMRGDRKPVDALGVALVGSRQPTTYGRAAAERLARELAAAGVTVVSGLARGIDSAAHEAVLARGGRTVGILGSGFGCMYPPENARLAARMAESGAVVTEFPWPVEPLAANFPRRNRLIAGMSLAVVVVEADVKSGALITARLAAEQGREVFAVPGSIFSPLSRGPHLLLKEGVKPVEDAQDVLDALEVFRDLLPRPRPARAAAPALSREEAGLLDRLSLDPAPLDALAAGTRLPPGALASALLSLELKGMVKALPGKTYVRAEAALRG